MFKKVVVGVEIVAVVAALVAVLLLFVAQPGDEGVAAGSGRGAGDRYLAETGALPTNGAEIYALRCARCHGADGRGGVGPRLAGRVADAFPDVEDQITLVLRGRGGMPGFSSLGDADVRLVVEYTRTGLGR